MDVFRRPRFIDDLAESYVYLAERNRGAADRLLDEVEALVTLLTTFPEIGRVRDELGDGVRSFRLRRFPHVLFYKHAGAAIILLRMLHGARDAPANPIDD